MEELGLLSQMVQTLAGASVLGIPIVVPIMGSVRWIKEMGVKGKALTASSMGVGLVFGCSYQVAISGVPADFAAGFYYFVYGLTLGLVASGIYKLTNKKP